MDLIKKIIKQLGIHKKESVGIVDSGFDIMKCELGKGKDVKICAYLVKGA